MSEQVYIIWLNMTIALAIGIGVWIHICTVRTIKEIIKNIKESKSDYEK